ncbi:hypothetical protein DIPPA_35839 [Diplonema papillatum]|nr:hypothetical protein DIPPA_35839 [Diplonema papillatum]
MTVRGDSKVSAALAMAAAETDMFRSGEEQARAAPASPKPELFLAGTLGNTGALELQQRRRNLLADHKQKLVAFAGELDTVGQQLIRNAVFTTRAVFRGTKHEDTVRKAIRQLASKSNLLTAAEASLAGTERTMAIYRPPRIPATESVPYKLSVVSSVVRTVSVQQQKIDEMTDLLTAAMANSKQVKMKYVGRWAKPKT